MGYMKKLRGIFKPNFNDSTNEWVLKIPKNKVLSEDDDYELRLPLILVKELAPGGNFLREERKAYRDFLLKKQNGRCAICGKEGLDSIGWVLDHQPPLGEEGSRFIDYEGVTENRVVHRQCHRRLRKGPSNFSTT
jgi:hypothetical protein